MIREAAGFAELFEKFGVTQAEQPLYDYGKLYASVGRYPVLFPASGAELSEIIRIAAEHDIPVRVRASGHTFNGASLPREGEVLIRTDRLNHFRFEAPGTVTAGAGALVWDIRDLAVENGFNLPIYNGGWAGPTLGGYLSAGGFGKGGLSGLFGGMWENVEALTFVDGRGEIRTIEREDALFPWLFGSFGQLGILIEAKLHLLWSSRNTARLYPSGACGAIPARQTDDPKLNDLAPLERGRPNLFWFSLLVAPEDEARAWQDLDALVAAHPGYLIPEGGWAGPIREGVPLGYHYVIKFRRFHPPLVYPRPETFLVIGVMSLLPSGDPESNRRLLALEREFIQLATAGGYRLYLQAENFGRQIDFRRYYGDAVFAELRRLKDECDPRGIFNRGIVFRSAAETESAFIPAVKKTVPLYVVEEHHEAYFAWGHAMLRGELRTAGNALLHVDEHSDLHLPAFRTPARERKADAAGLAAFTYRELGIASFILPAVYQGMFDEVCWLHPRLPKGRHSRLQISSWNGDEMNLQMSPAASAPAGGANTDHRGFDFRLLSLAEPFETERPVVLDIDIDFFSSDEGAKSCRLEVTRDEFDRFRGDRYHMLRLMPSKAARATVEDGRYFIEVTSSHPEPVLLPPPTAAQITERIDAFVHFLKANAVTPEIITVCRSRFSGFTPGDQWELIEQTLLLGLATLFIFEPVHIRDIAPHDF